MNSCRYDKHKSYVCLAFKLLSTQCLFTMSVGILVQIERFIDFLFTFRLAVYLFGIKCLGYKSTDFQTIHKI